MGIRYSFRYGLGRLSFNVFSRSQHSGKASKGNESKIKSLIGKIVSEVSQVDQVLDEGIKITFTDGSTIECHWYWQEGYYKIESA